MANRGSLTDGKVSYGKNEIEKLGEEVKNEPEEKEYIRNFSPLQWPEWNDTEVNLEDWKPKSQFDYYCDPEEILLPHSVMLNIISWKRPNEIFGDEVTLYKDSNDFDITSNNDHLMFSRFMRWIISSIGILKAITDENDCNVANEHNQHDANLQGKWKPWNHIYSFCKTGKVPHTPLINPSGKYIIRLYYLGCWRKFLIDDLLPVDSYGRIMLPVSTQKGELWPMLLAKGLLKIASHFWNKRDDLSGFQPISCLTGWVCEEIANMGFDDQKLKILIKQLLDNRENIQEKSYVREDKSNVFFKKESNVKHVTAKEISEMKQSKTIRQTEIIVTFKCWNEKYNGNKEFQRTFPCNEADILETSCNLPKDPVISMNFPALLCGYKEKDFISDGIEDIPNEWGLKSNFEKHDGSTVTFIKAYSNLLDVKDTNEMGMDFDKTEKETLKMRKKAKDTKPRTPKSPKSEALFEKKKKMVGEGLQKYPVTGKWLSFDSFVQLLEGIVLIYKPTLFPLNYQKPDFTWHHAKDLKKKVQNIENADHCDENIFNKEEEIEEKFIFIDSSESSQLIISLDVLPIPTKAENAIALLCDLTTSDEEESSEEGFENNSLAPKKGNKNSSLLLRTRGRKSETDYVMKISNKSMEFLEENQWEIIEGDERYFCENLLYDEDLDISRPKENKKEILEMEGFVMKLYEYQGTVKETYKYIPKCNTSAKTYTGETQTLFDEENINSEELEGNVERLESYLLSNKIQKSKASRTFNTAEDLEEFDGEFLLSSAPSLQMAAAHLYIDFFDWQSKYLGQKSLHYAVANSKCVSIELPSGRNILRVATRAATFCFFHVLCTVEAKISTLDCLFSEMAKDSKKIIIYEENIHQIMRNSIEELKKGDYVGALKDFQNCCLLQNYNFLPKEMKKHARQGFQDSICLLLMNYSHSVKLKDMVSTFRVVFLNPCFGKFEQSMDKSMSKKASITKTRSLESNILYSAKHNQAAIKLQSFFRMIECRNLLRRLKGRRIELADHVTSFMDLLRRDKNVSIMRTMLQRRPELKKLYDLRRDLKNEVDMYEWNGMCIHASYWITLVRYSFTWETEEAMKATILVTCPIQSVMITVIDNDTGRKLPGNIGSWIVETFQKNKEGYTFFAYGISEHCNQSVAPWKVNHVVAKGSPPIKMLINGQPKDTVSPPGLRCDTLKGYYIPNMEKIICSFKMIIQEPVVTSLFFTTSAKSTYFQFQLFEKEILVMAFDAEGILTIPYLFLRGSCSGQEESPICYVGKVTLKGEWPLSEFQTKFAETQWINDTALTKVSEDTLDQDGEKSVHNPQTLLKDSDSGLEASFDDVQEEDRRPAVWSLSVILDSPHRVILKEVKKKAEYIVNMKKQWEAAHPGALKRYSEFFTKHKERNFNDCLKYFKNETGIPSALSPEKVEFKTNGEEENYLQDIKLNNECFESPNTEVRDEYFNYIEKLIKTDFYSLDEATCVSKSWECKLHECSIEGFDNIASKRENITKESFTNTLTSINTIEKLQQRLNSLSDKRKNFKTGCDSEDIENKISLDLEFKVKATSDVSLGEYLIKYLENHSLCVKKRQVEDDFEIKLCSHILEESGHEDSNKNNYQKDEVLPPNASERCEQAPSVITIEDWVNIQKNTIQRKEYFKKKMKKIFAEEEQLLSDPMSEHHAKWNHYLLEVMKIDEDPFQELEKFRKAYRHKFKKIRLAMRENRKKEARILKDREAESMKKGKSKNEKKVKKFKKENQK